MKKFILIALIPLLVLAGCHWDQSSDDKQSEQQELILQEGTSKVGMPAIKNFREKKLLKDIFELRDQANITTFTYLYSDMQGKYTFFCNSIGYGIPYSTQFTSPSKISEYYSQGRYVVPQAEPNGLYSPASSDGTWVLCQDPTNKSVKPVYVEPKIIVSPFELKGE